MAGEQQVCLEGLQEEITLQSGPLQRGRGGNFSAQMPPAFHFRLAKFHLIAE